MPADSTRPEPFDAALDDSAEPPSSLFRVEVTNETDATLDVSRLAAAVQLALSGDGWDEATVSVAVVDNPTIHRLNRQFLEHDYPTDVLSFVLEPPPQLVGEIIASFDTACAEAAEAGWAAEDELLLYVVHGALHLAGHLDKDPDDAAEMRAAERDVLFRLGVTVSPQDSRWKTDRSADSTEGSDA
jgi:probable rRNA maturation factor